LPIRRLVSTGAPGKKKPALKAPAFLNEVRRITSSLLSSLQQVLLGQQALRPQQVLQVLAQEPVQQQELVRAQELLLSCHRQQVPKR